MVAALHREYLDLIDDLRYGRNEFALGSNFGRTREQRRRGQTGSSSNEDEEEANEGKGASRKQIMNFLQDLGK